MNSDTENKLLNISRDSSDSEDSKLKDKNLVSIPVDLDDPKFQEKLTKTQLYSVIKSLNTKLVDITDKFAKVNNTPDIEGIIESVVKRLENKEKVKESDTTKPLSGSNWTTEAVESFMRSYDLMEKPFKNDFKGFPYEKEVNTEHEFVGFGPGGIGKIFTPRQPPVTVSPRILKLDPNTPKFHGNLSEDVDDWLYKVRINLGIAGIPEDSYCDFITNYCVGKAGVFLRRLREEYSTQHKPLGWQNLRDAFIKRYRPIDYTRRIRNQLMQIRQGNDFNAYVDQFQHLLNQLEPNEMSEQEKLHYFTEGVTTEAKFQIISRQIKSVDSAILIASELDSCRAKTVFPVQMAHRQHNRPKQHEYTNRMPQHNRGNPINRNNYRTPFNTSSSNQNNNQRHNQNNRQNNNQNNNPQKQKPQMVNQQNEKSKPTCFRCKKIGHLASNCRVKLHTAPNKQEEILSAIDNQLEMLKIKGTLNEINVDFFFDSGATTSIISQRIVKQHNLQILPSSVQIKSANNSVDTVIGITESLRINVENHICNLQLLIMDLDQYDVLLGLNWFQATKAGLYPAQKILKFEAEQIHLDTNDMHDEIEEVNVMGIDEEDLLPINFEILSEKDEVIRPSILLTSEQSVKFNDLVNHINKIKLFAYNYKDLEGCDLWPHVINTSTEIPIYVPRYRKSQYENDLIKAEITKLLEANIIRPSSSPWSSSVVLVPKPHNEKRLCIDYRKVNAITIPDMFPLPRIQDILDSLSGSKWFTVFDLKSGYYQTFIDEKSIQKTAFTTADGHYEFIRTPFGLKNAPSQFSRFMQMLFGNRKFISLYLDDLTIHSSSFEDHIKHIRITVDILKQHNLKINKKKCVWFADTIKLLGHIVSGGIVKMDPEKIKAIMERKPPTNRKQVQEFLGLPNYYRRFINNFADITYPIAKLLKKDVPFDWDKDCSDSFELLKEKVTEAPVLQQPDLSKQLYYTVMHRVMH